jgi:hypothetical protein
MTKASKARMIAYLENSLLDYDRLIELNVGNEAAIKSFEAEYRKVAATLAAIRDTETSD